MIYCSYNSSAWLLFELGVHQLRVASSRLMGHYTFAFFPIQVQSQALLYASSNLMHAAVAPVVISDQTTQTTT